MDGIARIEAQCTEGDPEYMVGYHQVYRLQLGAGGLAIDDGELSGQWHSADYELGRLASGVLNEITEQP